MSERTLAAHMCIKKRRWADKDLTHTRLGYRVFQMFYEMNTTAKNPKTQEEFIQSQYYEGFVKFGRSCLTNEYLQPEKFAEWLIKTGKKLKDWSKDSLYDEFLLTYVKKEPGMKALERKNSDFANNFTYSLHHVFPRTVSKIDVLHYESLLKNKLGSRAYGLNEN